MIGHATEWRQPVLGDFLQDAKDDVKGLGDRKHSRRLAKPRDGLR
jgi:hypothetical protein